METLIEDLLVLSREGDAVTDFEPVNLTTMAEECWRTVETANATLVTDIDCRAQTDPTRLKQLFENLIRNAVEHGGANVTITVGELEEGFYIEDDGPGIPESDHPEVFTAGFTTNTEGTGFGLSIVKRVVEAHNWEIRLSEATNGGTRFEITDVEFATE
jgi:signal transduction histidine kinase